MLAPHESRAPATSPSPTVQDGAKTAVLLASTPLPEATPTVRGFDWNAALASSEGVSLHGLLGSFLTTGFQATNLGMAIKEIERMRAWRLSDVPVAPDEDDDLIDPAVRATIKCKIFLAYTSNLISSGLRETLRFIVEHKLVDVVVTTAGGVEEDLIKCLAPTRLGDFSLPGIELRKRGINRIGNLLVPNDNYCKFEDWVTPILHAMAAEQNTEGRRWTPSRLIERLGNEINNPDSIYYWAAKNQIPVFCPALTDGSLGDMLYFFSYKHPEFVVDMVADIRRLNDEAVHAKATGMIILGGGLVKHHTCNANLMRNGADFAVFVNTGQEFDGSDSGARPDEAVSWGKVKMDAHPVKVYGDATLVFPLLVAETFAKEVAAERGREGGGGGKVEEESAALKRQRVVL
ncbi:deoxyhypusine synthase [Nannochloropsis oceanica]